MMVVVEGVRVVEEDWVPVPWVRVQWDRCFWSSNSKPRKVVVQPGAKWWPCFFSCCHLQKKPVLHVMASAEAPEVSDDLEPEEEVLHPLSAFFQQWEGRSGLYFLSPYFDPDRPTARYPVKVGLSRHRVGRSDAPEARRRGAYGGLGRRLDSYLLCYPSGFYVYAILEGERSRVYDMEKFFHEYFTGKNFQSQKPHSHREEWFHLSCDDVFATIRAYDRAHPHAVKTFLVFPPPGGPQFVDTNGRLAAHGKKNLPLDQKLMLEHFMSPDRVPQTLPRKKKNKTDHDNDEGEDDVGTGQATVPFTLNEL